MSTFRPAPAASRSVSRRRRSRLISGVTALAAVALMVGVLAAGRHGDGASRTMDGTRGRGDSVPLVRAMVDSVVSAGGADGAACEVPVLRRDTLRDAQGRPFFLAPDAMLSRDGELFIAGQNSVRVVLDATGAIADAEQDHVLVAIRGRDGRVRTFARPEAIGSLSLTPVRAAALPDGRWALLLTHRPAELEAPIHSRVWLAVLGPSGWQSVVEVDTLAGVRILDGPSDPLAVRGERLLAALPAIQNDEQYGAMLLEGTAERPTLRFVPLPGAAYAAAVFAHGTDEPVLVAVHPDRTLRSSGNALHLHRLNRPGVPPQPLSDGGMHAIHAPRVAAVPGGFAVTATRHARRDRQAPVQAVHVQVPDDGTIVTHLLGEASGTVAHVQSDAAQLYTGFLEKTASAGLSLSLHAFPGPGRGMRLAVNAVHAEVLGLVADGASDLIVATLHGDVSQAQPVSLALTWISPRCRSTSGAEDAR